MMELIKNELNRTQTENGDTAYISTYHANLDFFGLAQITGYFLHRLGVAADSCPSR